MIGTEDACKASRIIEGTPLNPPPTLRLGPAQHVACGHPCAPRPPPAEGPPSWLCSVPLSPWFCDAAAHTWPSTVRSGAVPALSHTQRRVLCVALRSSRFPGAHPCGVCSCGLRIFPASQSHDVSAVHAPALRCPSLPVLDKASVGVWTISSLQGIPQGGIAGPWGKGGFTF